MNIFKKLISLPGILLLTAAIYYSMPGNGFINWDDTEYITENLLIRNISLAGILKIFSTLHFNGYLPITQVSLAIDYFFWQTNPIGYHLTSLLLHFANIILVYLLAFQIINNKQAAFITCLLFAIHPTRVESVAWASERKDVLYAFFYLLSLWSYSRYIKSNLKIAFFFFSLIFFTLSVFSKWSAYPLPFLLLFFDLYLGRKMSRRILIEKLVFLVIPLVSVYIHFSIGTVVKERFLFSDRIFLGSYSLLFYINKFFFPFNLSGIYPYPGITDGLLPAVYYLSFIAFIGLGVLVYRIIKKFPSERNFLLFCILFFITNLGMVLHILSPIGGVVVAADRYTYMAYLGLFFIAGKYGEIFYSKLQGKLFQKKAVLLIFAGVVVLFSIKTIQRIKIWKNSHVFFTDIIKKDSTIAFAWNNLGFYEAEEGKLRLAIDYYTRAIELNPEFSFAYNNRGLAYDALGLYESAIKDFNEALTIKNNEDPTLYFNRGLTYYHLLDYENAVNDLSAALNLSPAEAQYYIKRGAIKNDMENYSGALEDFMEAARLSPRNAEAFNYLGLSYNYLGLLEQALQAYDRAVALNPDYSSAYNNRGWVKFSLNDKEGAMNDFSKSIELDSLYSYPYHNRGLLYYDLNMPDKACEDWQSASKLGYVNSRELIHTYCNRK